MAVLTEVARLVPPDQRPLLPLPALTSSGCMDVRSFCQRSRCGLRRGAGNQQMHRDRPPAERVRDAAMTAKMVQDRAGACAQARALSRVRIDAAKPFTSPQKSRVLYVYSRRTKVWCLGLEGLRAKPHSPRILSSQMCFSMGSGGGDFWDASR